MQCLEADPAKEGLILIGKMHLNISRCEEKYLRRCNQVKLRQYVVCQFIKEKTEVELC